MVGSKNPSSDHYKVTTPHTHEYVNKKTPRSSQKLLDTMRTIRQPHEIWQEMDEKGDPTAKIYLRVFDLPHGKKAMLGVRWESESKRMHTYYENLAPDKLERKRKGKLLYKRNAGTR